MRRKKSKFIVFSLILLFAYTAIINFFFIKGVNEIMSEDNDPALVSVPDVIVPKKTTRTEIVRNRRRRYLRFAHGFLRRALPDQPGYL